MVFKGSRGYAELENKVSLNEADGVFFGETEDLTRGRGDAGAGIGDLFAVELDCASRDELLAEVAIGFFEPEGGLKDVADEGKDGGVGGEVGGGELGELGGGEVAFGEAGFPIVAGGFGILLAVVAGGDFRAELLFGLHGVEGGVALFAEEKGVVAVHELIGDAHDLAEHVVGCFGDADVVVVGFGHLLHAVESFEEGHGHDDLLWLALLLLEVAADEDVEELVGAADFDVGADFDGVPALDDGVLDFVEADFLTFFDPRFEILALEHLLHGDAGVEAEDVFEGHLPEPVTVEDDLGFVRVEDLEGLGGVGFGVGEDVLAGKRGTGGGAAGGVADAGGEVADDEDGLVAEELELAEFLHDHGVAEVDVGRGGVDAEFDAEGSALAELVGEFLFGKDFGSACGEALEGIGDGVAHESAGAWGDGGRGAKRNCGWGGDFWGWVDWMAGIGSADYADFRRLERRGRLGL